MFPAQFFPSGLTFFFFFDFFFVDFFYSVSSFATFTFNVACLEVFHVIFWLLCGTVMRGTVDKDKALVKA